MSISLNRFCLMVLLANPSAIELLTWRGVAGCVWPILRRVVRIGKASWPLMKVAPILAWAAETMKFLMVLETLKMGPLRLVSVLGDKRGFGDRSLRK